MLPNLTVKCTLTCHILIGIIYGRILHEYKNPGSKKIFAEYTWTNTMRLAHEIVIISHRMVGYHRKSFAEKYVYNE